MRRLTHVISRMASTIITWPNEEEKQETRNFFQMKGFSNVIGAIDGSHIRIDKPSSDPDSYYNRKKYFSIHVCIFLYVLFFLQNFNYKYIVYRCKLFVIIEIR